MTHEYKPLFNNQHYVWLASAMRDANSQLTWASDRQIFRQTAESLAASLRGDNPAFDEEQFLNLIFNLNPLKPAETIYAMSIPCATLPAKQGWWPRNWKVKGKSTLWGKIS